MPTRTEWFVPKEMYQYAPISQKNKSFKIAHKTSHVYAQERAEVQPIQGMYV